MILSIKGPDDGIAYPKVCFCYSLGFDVVKLVHCMFQGNLGDQERLAIPSRLHPKVRFFSLNIVPIVQRLCSTDE